MVIWNQKGFSVKNFLIIEKLPHQVNMNLPSGVDCKS